MGCHFIKPKSPRCPWAGTEWAVQPLRAWQACRSYFPTPLVTTPWKGCLWSCLDPNASSTEHAGLCPFLLSLMSLAKIKSNMVPKRWKTIFKPCPLSPAFRRKSRTLRKRPILALWSQWRKPDLFVEASATQNCQPYDVIWAPALKCLRRRGQIDMDDQGDNGGDSEHRAGWGGLVGCRLCHWGGELCLWLCPGGAISPGGFGQDAAWKGRDGLPCGTPACYFHSSLCPSPDTQWDSFQTRSLLWEG